MRKIATLFTMSMICLLKTVFAESGISVSLMPKWKVGDRWSVRTWYAKVTKDPNDSNKPLVTRKGVPIEVTFEVSNVAAIEGHECFELKVTFPKDQTNFQRRYKLYYTKNEHALICLINTSLRDDGSVVNSQYNYSFNTNVPVLTLDVGSIIPFDTPAFAQPQKISKGRRKNREVTQEISESGEKQGSFVVVMSTKYNGKTRVVLQEWELDLPWWKSVNITMDGEIVSEAEFVNPEQWKR